MGEDKQAPAAGSLVLYTCHGHILEDKPLFREIEANSKGPDITTYIWLLSLAIWSLLLLLLDVISVIYYYYEYYYYH